MTMTVMVPPVSCLSALVTSSLVSSTAVSTSTGTSQARIAARTWLRASPAAAGPAASEIRRGRCTVGRMGAIVSICLPCRAVSPLWGSLGCLFHDKYCCNLH